MNVNNSKLAFQPFAVQLVDLTLLQLTNWRWSWRSLLLTGALAPIFTILALGVFARNNGPTALGYVLAGNIVISLLFSTMGQVSGHFAFMRAVGRLEFFATLPIHRTALILATLASFFVLAIPSTLITIAFGAAFLEVPLQISPLALFVIPLISVSLSGLGALIGLIGRTPEETGSLNLVATFVLSALGPVIIPPESLPPIMNTIGLLSPATYAASALRQVMLGWPDRLPLALDVVVLVAITLGFLWLVGRKLDWRVS
jgi:ABC-2 type transport system permease protein